MEILNSLKSRVKWRLEIIFGSHQQCMVVFKVLEQNNESRSVVSDSFQLHGPYSP